MSKAVQVIELSQRALPNVADGQVLVLPIPDKPYKLRIVLPGTAPVLSETNVLRCNYTSRAEHFDRAAFQEYPLEAGIMEDAHVELEISHSGAFEVRIGERVAWNFVVANGFSLNGEQLTADALCVQTLLSKLVDPDGDVHSRRWQEALDNVAAKNYNMIHFVPLQPRGESDSPFSIAEQLDWDKQTFPKGEADVAYLLSELEKRGILGLSDIVLNHTASDSEWLADHPDAAYTPDTAPHLQAAIDLDTELLEFEGAQINDADELNAVVDRAVKQAADSSRLWEYYVVDVDTLAETVEKHPYQGVPSVDLSDDLAVLAEGLVGAAAKGFGQLGSRFSRSVDTSVLAEYVAGSAFSARDILNQVNVALYREYNADIAAATSSIKDRQRYLRLDSNGPQIGSKVDGSAPLIETYFNRRFGTPLACNGWVWAGNPLVDHAGRNSRAYIRRELIVWQDCTKLRYGERPQDSPYLWDRMARYVRMLAKHFAGLRIDNCHSTPLHVGEYILDEARRIRPNLYVVAELFSGSQAMDKLYVERLGIASLLREAIMAGSPQDLSTVVHQNGGAPIGSLIDTHVSGRSTHSWLMEVTHDNETLAEKRTVEDTLPTAGLVAMCQVSSGCTYGNDECYGEALNIVSETRPYRFGGGITEAKGALNKIHQSMAKSSMSESFTDYKGQYISVHRINPCSGEGYFLLARTKFWKDDPSQTLDPITLEASLAEWECGWSLRAKENAGPAESESASAIHQIATELAPLEPLKPKIDNGSSVISIDPSQFPQGSVAVWKTKRSFDAGKIERLISDRESADAAVKDLNLIDLNQLIFCVEGEERTLTKGERGVFVVPEYGPLVYAGLQGWESELRKIVEKQELGHQLCNNLRNGLWAFEYLVGRSHQDKLQGWLKERLEATRSVPSFLRPRYFAATVMLLYQSATAKALALLKVDPNKTSKFYKKLALTSIQMVNQLPNCSLLPTSSTPTMAAGLPHFSEGVMRCWGRDVFLSVGGLLLRLGRFEDAKQHIIGFGSTLKYGLIPNLLDSGNNPRYNARDAAWFFVEAIQDYCKITNTLEILDEKVRRRFPLDDSYTDAPTDIETKVGDLVFEILARHAKGIEFREHNAGRQIDMHMKDNGFNQRIWTDWETGIVFGGNKDNCGSWQDKMGESDAANNDGVPGTPRDGAAIEITAMLKSCLRWVNEVRQRKDGYDWPESVENQHGEKVTLARWEELLQSSFERCYFIPEHPSAEYDVDSSIVNRKEIYKDVYRSTQPFEDYQLRANFTFAVVVAPELFEKKKAMRALEIADKVLRGPLGMATLDPSDWNYRPYYINSEDSTDFATSRGRNYHQGPEWVWLFGTFLQAYVQTLKRNEISTKKILKLVRERIQEHVDHIEHSEWAGLPELTQKAGEFCADSSPTQAWSTARLIEALHAVAQL